MVKKDYYFEKNVDAIDENIPSITPI